MGSNNFLKDRRAKLRERALAGKVRNGVPLLPPREGERRVTTEMVAQLRDEQFLAEVRAAEDVWLGRAIEEGLRTPLLSRAEALAYLEADEEP